MEILSDFLIAAMAYSDRYAKAEEGFEVTIGQLAGQIDRMIGALDNLSSSLSLAQAGLVKTQTGSYAEPTIQYAAEVLQPGTGAMARGNENSEGGKAEEKEKSFYEKGAEIFESSSKVAEAANSGIKIGQSLDILPASVEKLTKPIELIGNVSTAVKGGMELVSAQEKGSVEDGIKGVSDLLKGASGIIAAAELASGPIGWAIMGGTVLAGAAVTYWDHKQQQKEQEEQTKAQSVQSIKTFEATEQEGRGVLDEIDIISKRAKAEVNGPHHKWSTNYDAQKDVTTRYGQDAYDTRFMYLPTGGKPQDRTNGPYVYKMNSGMDGLMPKNYLEQTIGIQNALRKAGHTEGRMKYMQEVNRIIADAYKNDRLNHVHTADMITLATKEVTNELFSEANGNTAVLNTAPPPKRQMAGTRMQQTGHRAGGAPVTINLNRPMIEQFTVNTKEGKDGINDFRRKVEEVLLEILNSANAI